MPSGTRRLAPEATRTERYGDHLFRLDEPEHRRLRLLGEVFDPLTFRCLASAPIPPGARCLDVGTGAGSVARWLSRRLPDGEVVATDLAPELLGPPAERNLTVLRHDVTVDPFPDGSFDLIHVRFVLSHLPRRRQILHQMARWLRPGGRLVLGSFGWFPLDSSPHEDYRQAMDAHCRLTRDRIGTDARWSRSHPLPLRAAGLDRLGVETAVPQLQGGNAVADFWRRTLAAAGPALLDGGYLTEDALTAALDRLQDPGFWDLSPAFVQSWGYRPR
ncbi:class I SAM-dependent methyltransferase [Kitasatospora sp. NPDC052896]|uniref:class I SAM-dependent methyltransferase n=1 Tax=Kitasatospora sp. NPDC052896 TaxID=3364061 RepID=UPI0037CB92F2